MAKATRKAKQSARRSQKSQRKVNKQAGKGMRKMARQDKRTASSLRRTEKRGAMSAARTSKRQNVKSGKLSKKQYDKLSKVYGELSPEEINQLNAIAPYTDTMAQELEENDIPLNDDSDPLEVAAKYTMYNDEIETPFDEDLIEESYGENEDDEISDFEHAEKKFNSQRALLTALGGISGGVSAYLRDIEDKARSGEELTPQEKKALDAKSKGKKALTRAALDFNLQDIAPILIIGIAAFFILKK